MIDYMNILFDHQAFEMQPYGGVSRYYYELIKDFSNNSLVNPIISLKRTNNQYIFSFQKEHPDSIIPGYLKGFQDKKLSSYDAYGNITSSIIWNIRLNYQKYINKRIREENQRISLKTLKSSNFDVFHPTYYNPYFLKSIGEKPFILTIHDLIQEKFPELFSLQDDAIQWKRQLIHEASHIIAVSNTTKKDIISFYKIPEKKISVIYHGTNFSPLNEIKSDNVPNLPSSFLLYVGERHLHKNFYFMIEALEPLLSKESHLHMVCCGGGKFNSSELMFFNMLGISQKISHIESPEKILQNCYKRAIALLYPSIYEGFGIPLIEAFSMGCPVIASNIPTTQEICSGAYIGFEPKDPDSLRNAVQLLMNDNTMREKCVENGYKKSESFTWRIAAEKTLAVYNSTISGL